MTDLHSMDDLPPQDPTMLDQSVNVILHYPQGVTERGYKCGWLGWMYWLDGLPQPVEEDTRQPIGWTLTGAA